MEMIQYLEDGCIFYEGRFFRGVEELNDFSGGKIICERVDTDCEGRLRMHKIYANPIERENGLKDFYTYTKERGLLAGFYLCEIKEFKLDRNGFINLVVETIVFLGKNIMRNTYGTEALKRAVLGEPNEADKAVWEYIRGELSPIALKGAYSGRFNTKKVFLSPAEVMRRITSGDIGIIEKVSRLLESPTDIELAVEYCYKNFSKLDFQEKFPILSSKITELKRHELETLLERKVREFEEKQLILSIDSNSSTEELWLAKVEAALNYWREFNLNKKAAEKAARKAAKAVKTAKA